jgi:hypothetical protein
LFPILGTSLERRYLQFWFCFGKSRSHIEPFQTIIGDHSHVFWRSESEAASVRRWTTGRQTSQKSPNVKLFP